MLNSDVRTSGRQICISTSLKSLFIVLYQSPNSAFGRNNPSGHFPHFWTEGGPICSKFAMGRRLDRPWTSRRITARDYYRGCMRIECTRRRSHAYRTYTCERGQEQTFLYNWGTRTRWFHEQADRFYYSLVKGVCSSSTYGKVRIRIPIRSGCSQHACMRQGNRMSPRVTAHDVHSRSTPRPMAKF